MGVVRTLECRCVNLVTFPVFDHKHNYASPEVLLGALLNSKRPLKVMGKKKRRNYL